MISGSSMFTFDAYNQVEIQPIYLANPDGTILYNLGTIYDRNFELRFNTMSTFSFTAPSSADGIATDYYNWLQYRRLVYVDNIGTFMITEISRENDGMMETKKVVCKSLEVMLSYKKLTLFTGTYKFYSSTAPEGTLMEEVMSYIPGWTIAYVSEELDDYDNTAGIYRTFDVTDKTIYDFLMNEVSQTFQCVFVFDSIEKTISIYTIEEATQPSDIFISFENLMESFSISESTGELVTALTVYGGDSKEGELGINLVNPLGTNTIYNFSYFKNTSWMDADLVTAITNWEALVEANRTSYSNYLTAYKEKNREILFYKSTSLTLSAEMAALNLEKDVLLEGGFSLDSILAEISDKQDEIDANYNALTTATQEANTILESLRAINTAVSFETNFTSEQIEKLDNFIIGNTYTNTNFLITDIMSDVEVQEMATELYTEGVNVLSKVAQPRYTFELNMANFLFIKEFEPFIAQLAFGEEITVEISAGSFLYPVLLGIDFNYDDPNQFKMLLSNRLRMGDEEFQYNDLFGSIVDSSTTSEFNSKKWNDISGFFG
ncbi:MAG: phage tail protein, partial [Prolixibacteraceae bacterium]|nr:phage tail protein [Prolixibacteraceae bacterium]